MKKSLYLLIIIGVISGSILSAPALAGDVYTISSPSGVSIAGTSYLTTIMVNQDPSTAEPNGYVDVLFKLENKGTEDAQNVSLELLSAYPFSLDPGVNATQDIGTIRGSQTGDNAFLIKYKLKVDKDAVDGSSEVKLEISQRNGNGMASSIQTFNVSVSNPRTDFDVVLQQSTSTTSTQTSTTGVSAGSSVMLGVANIGANTASAVIVKIPTQENFRAVGTSGSIIGNLNAGDYTIVTFQLVPNVNESFHNSTIRNNSVAYGDGNLTVQISYTDTLGIRRTVEKDVPLALTSASSYVTGRATQSSSSGLSLSNSLIYIVIGVVGIAVVVVLFKIRTRKKK